MAQDIDVIQYPFLLKNNMNIIINFYAELTFHHQIFIAKILENAKLK